jgi:hypothetical protein
MLESCQPKQSTENDCSIFTGLLSVYGVAVTTTTLETLMNEFRNEFPTFSISSNDDTNSNNSNTTDEILDTFIAYGVSRMNVSEAFTRIVHTPDASVPSIKTKLSILIPMTMLFVLAIVLIGIYVIVRYVRVKRYIDYECKPTNNKSTSDSKQDYPSNKGEYIVRSTFWDNLVFRSSDRNSCDRTETSSSSVTTSRSIRQSKTIRTIRTICTKRRLRQNPIGSIEYSTKTEPDCIYIVEPDGDYTDDNDTESIGLHQQIEKYDSKLYTGSGTLIDNQRYIPRKQNDPLYFASSIDSNIGFEVN